MHFFQKLNSSQKAAAMITAALVFYLLIANLVAADTESDEMRVAVSSDKNLANLVKTQTMRATNKPLHIILYGFTEANRHVRLKAQTEGEVVEILTPEGNHVKAGDPILKIDERDRAAKAKQAEALLKQREVEYEAASKLRKTGAQSEVRFMQSKAQLEEAKALVAATKEDLDNTTIRAPFDGVLEDVSVEVGDLVGRGFVVNGEDAVATVVEYHPLVVSGQVPQQKRSILEKDKPATVKLIGNQKLEGTIRFVGTVTDPNTRTFRVEVEVANDDGAIPVGVSAELFLPAGEAMAYNVSPSVLSLDDEGNIGVKLVDANDRVHFHEVQLVEDSSKGVWVAGLPEEIRLITLGQNFVNEGQSITATASE